MEISNKHLDQHTDECANELNASLYFNMEQCTINNMYGTQTTIYTTHKHIQKIRTLKVNWEHAAVLRRNYLDKKLCFFHKDKNSSCEDTVLTNSEKLNMSRFNMSRSLRSSLY